MGWFRRIVRWLTGEAEPEQAIGFTPASSRAVAPRAEVDPYFADPSVSSLKKVKTLGLGAAAFLPISRDEIKKAAQGQSLFSNPWFGRRDRIPPTDDPRTTLIDRAMVTQGILSPEELVEIHRVGDEMERARPSREGIAHQASLAGEAAVLAEREARARLKAQKKEQAIERKHERRAAIAHRHATDIVFLGRGVSGKLSDRNSDRFRLAAAGLPVLSTPVDLARALGLTIPRLRWLAFHTEAATRSHYVRFTIPKRSGGARTLFRPHRTLAKAQRWVFENITSKLPVESSAHGFITGRSILTNAREHAGHAIVVNLDLTDFFPSIGFPRVRGVFQRAGYSPAVATILALLCTECPRRVMEYDGVTYHVATGPRGLPQGACTSPSLSNQVARRLDRRLSGLAGMLGIAYTRYADDLTFSGDGELQDRVGYLMARVRHIALDEGFVVNEAKSRVLRQNGAQVVTGLVVNDRPGVDRKEVRRLRAILHRARTEGFDRQNHEQRPNFIAWLRGKIAFVAMARPEVGAALLAEFEATLRH
jgi:retron-type reverse transcriptase